MESPREQLLETVTTLLRGMTGPRFWSIGEDWMTDAEKTYPNPITVLRSFRVPAQASEYPLVCVLEGQGARREFGGTGGIGHYTDHFPFLLYGYVLGGDPAMRDLWLHRLRYDIFLTLVTAPVPIKYLRNFDFASPENTGQGAEPDRVGTFEWTVTAVLDDQVHAA